MSQNEPRPEGGPLAASVERLRHELDRWMEAAFSQGERALDAFGLRGPLRAWTPQLDLIESAEEFEVTADLPGVDPRSVDVTLVGNVLMIKGEKAGVQPVEGQAVHCRERDRGPFARSVTLPSPVNPDSVTAEAKDGCLRIRLIKADVAKTRQIPVKAEPRAPEIGLPPGAQI